ncbi:MAG: hypothetical protein JWN20_1572, partial [Jatrophihabitantaceae bacterium]|nr:hypothetical protein [Jatrophihabitantaceae bacterium]
TAAGVSTATYGTSWTPTAPGTYYWIASYAGDASNNAFTTGCGDAHEQVVVASAQIVAASPPPPRPLANTGNPVLQETGVALTLLFGGAFLFLLAAGSRVRTH